MAPKRDDKFKRVKDQEEELGHNRALKINEPGNNATSQGSQRRNQHEDGIQQDLRALSGNRNHEEEEDDAEDLASVAGNKYIPPPRLERIIRQPQRIPYQAPYDYQDFQGDWDEQDDQDDQDYQGDQGGYHHQGH